MRPDHDDILDDELEAMLSGHLAQRLDPQRGKALAAFECDGARRPTGSTRRWALLTLAPTSLAAAVLIGWILTRPGTPPVQPQRATGPIEAGLPPDHLVPGEVERLFTWRAIDEGARVINDAPVRRVRLRAVEEIQWADPELDATIRLAVPREQVILVRQQTF